MRWVKFSMCLPFCAFCVLSRLTDVLRVLNRAVSKHQMIEVQLVSVVLRSLARHRDIWDPPLFIKHILAELFFGGSRLTGVLRVLCSLTTVE